MALDQPEFAILLESTHLFPNLHTVRSSTNLPDQNQFARRL
jgi:hypothetical protein